MLQPENYSQNTYHGMNGKDTDNVAKGRVHSAFFGDGSSVESGMFAKYWLVVTAKDFSREFSMHTDSCMHIDCKSKESRL